MPRRNLTPEIANKLISLAKDSDSISAVISASGYSRHQINKWRSEDDTFNTQIENALRNKQYHTFSWADDWHNSEIKSQYERLIFEYFKKGYIKKKITKKTRTDPDGNIIFTDTTEEIISEPTPSWVFNLVSPKQMPVLEAMGVLLSEGVATDAQADIVAKGILKIEDDLREAFPAQLELDFGD